MTTDTQAYYGQTRQTTTEGEFNQMRFVISQQIAKLQTSLPVRVESVQGGGLAPVGFVTITVLVNQLSGDDKPFPGATIPNVPYMRLQGGSNAVIIDPKPGDIGMACFASRDITAVKNARQSAPPGSKRRYNFSDAMYVGGFLNGAPTQYIQFTDGGIVMHSPTALEFNAPNITLNGNTTINGNTTLNGDTAVVGSMQNNGTNVGSTHTHGGVQTGNGSTGTAQ